MQIEQLEQHYENFDVSKMEPGGELHFTADDVKNQPAQVIPKICGIYQAVRPFLDWASRFFLIPKKIKTVIKGFLDLMDQVCPGETV